LSLSEARPYIDRWGRAAVTEAVRSALATARQNLATGGGASGASAPDAFTDPLGAAESILERRSRPGLCRVLNGTGVVLHTNLGRAPLAREALNHLVSVGLGYSNLEFDLSSGTRGSRDSHCADRLCRLTGSEDALVVNNTAAAVVLAVNSLSRGRHVVVSRGELVEIGGSFRLPSLVSAAGGILVEVGTTNRTRASDFREAIGPETGMLLKVHPSNFRIEGFTEDVSVADLVAIGREAEVPVVHDLGSGLLASEAAPQLPPEPVPGDSVRAGADLVLWSGDKLLGGPQAGIIHGHSEWVSRLRRSPLLRALRVDKLTLAALEVTLILHENLERSAETVPALARLAESAASIRRRAEARIGSLPANVRDRVAVVELRSLVGGGTFPGVELESAGWCVEAPPVELEQALRAANPPLVARTVNDRVVIDFRTLAPGADEREAAAVVSAAVAAVLRAETGP
jgi:L-seryl-tRNA(Ser) seleniumtransferase